MLPFDRKVDTLADLLDHRVETRLPDSSGKRGQDLGYELVSVDLPGHGGRLDEVATFEAYCDAVLEVLQRGDVLVGHSSRCVIAVLRRR